MTALLLASRLRITRLLALGCAPVALAGCPQMLSDDFKTIPEGSAGATTSGGSDASGGNGGTTGGVTATGGTTGGVTATGGTTGGVTATGGTTGGVTATGGTTAGVTATGGSGGQACAGVNFDSDAFNCGFCGHDCQGSACTAGECAAKVLSTGVQPKGLAIDGDTLYFADELAAAIRVMPADGSAKPTTFAAGQSLPRYLTIAASKVYWTRGDGSLVMQPIGGTAASVIASGLSRPLGVGVFGANAYVADANTGALLQLPIAGGKAVTLSSTTSGNYVEGVATDGQMIWVAYNLGAQIVEVPVAGGQATAFVTTQGSPAGVALDADWVYWANQGSGEIRKRQKSGGQIITLKTGVAHAVGVAVDAKFVYIAEGNNQRIARVAK